MLKDYFLGGYLAGLEEGGEGIERLCTLCRVEVKGEAVQVLGFLGIYSDSSNNGLGSLDVLGESQANVEG